MNGYGSDPSMGTGSRSRPHSRGNRTLHDIPAADRVLTIHCHGGGSRQQPRLVAVVARGEDGKHQLVVMNSPHLMTTPRAGASRAVARTPCRCPDNGHVIDVGKVMEAAARMQYQPRKARRVDVRRVAPGGVTTSSAKV